MSAEFANLIALTNICANATEIMGIASGGSLLVTSFIPSASGVKGYSLKIAGVALLQILLGLAAPGIINLFNSLGTIGMVLSLIFGVVAFLLELAATLLSFFLPSILAYRLAKVNKTKILILNFLFFVPFNWLIAYIWACIPEKSQPVPIE